MISLFEQLKINRLFVLGNRKSSWKILSANDDFVLGYVFENSPTGKVVTRVILPTFDQLDFFHLSFGTRIYDDHRLVDIGTLVAKVGEDFERNRNPPTCSDFREYAGIHGFEGFYRIWIEFICLLRLKRLEDATNLDRTEALESKMRGSAVEDRYRAIKELASLGDHAAIDALFQSWTDITTKTLGLK